MIKILLTIVLLFTSCTKPAPKPPEVKKAKSRKVKVAAVQCYSRMGEIDYNRKLLTGLIRRAAEKGAKIIVLPEAAISGYMNPRGMKGEEIVWNKEAPEDEYSRAVQDVAEAVPGDSSQYFAELAAELKVYLTVPLIEKADGNFYNSLLLMNPKGEMVGHHRKRELWNHGDGSWCSKGDLPTQVVDTEFGKLGLMICYDHHIMPPLLAEKGAEIVLYSVGWNGPPDNWFNEHFPKKAAKHKFSAVVANWSHEKDSPFWVGAGYSNVLFRNGVVIKVTKKVAGSEIVIADIPLK